MPDTTTSDITIIGAGPAGSTAALMLGKKNVPCLLIDKYCFPREKICGDGLSGKVLSILNRIDPGLVLELDQSGFATRSYAARFFSPNHKMLELTFRPIHPSQPPGFICPRKDFDNFLLQKALLHSSNQFISGFHVAKISRQGDLLFIEDISGDKIIKTKLILFAAGADKKLIRQLDPGYAEKSEEGIGIRGYFENVSGADEKRAIEIHFFRELLPWYLWIFPYSDGSANVGLALPESLAQKSKKSLKELLFYLINKHPHLAMRFSDANLKGKIGAKRLPVYTGQYKIAGDNYMLLGDAARLVDPFTGEGVGNAMSSGVLAAGFAAKCIADRDFSSAITQQYQEAIYQKLREELDLNIKLQNLARRAKLLNLVIGKASGKEEVRNVISEMLYNTEAKIKLNKPVFYLKLLLGI